MPKIRLLESNANGWGFFSYMLHALRRNEKGPVVDRLKVRHAYVSITNSKEETIRQATKDAVSQYWAEIVYFVVPIKSARFGDLRNKGFIGFVTKGKPFQYFSKPLPLFEALEQIEGGPKQKGGE